MGKLDIAGTVAKASLGSNSQIRAVGIRLPIASITRSSPFDSLFDIQESVLDALKKDMQKQGFDQSKPVNVWKKHDGSRILIDGYTRMLAAEGVGLSDIVVYEMDFRDEAEAVEYAIHTQRDRRNLSDVELLRLIERLDQKQVGFKTSIASRDAIVQGQGKTAAITADILGVSESTVERARSVLDDSEEKAAVLAGRKSINRGAKDARRKKNKMAQVVKCQTQSQGMNGKAVSALYLDGKQLQELDRILRIYFDTNERSQVGGEIFKMVGHALNEHGTYN